MSTLSEISVTQWDTRDITVIRLLLFKLTQISNPGLRGARIRYCLPLHTRGLEDVLLLGDVRLAVQLPDVDAVAQELGAEDVGV